jgi:outer membrane protein OmpA-like peptidoglycan-associated protein
MPYQIRASAGPTDEVEASARAAAQPAYLAGGNQMAGRLLQTLSVQRCGPIPADECACHDAHPAGCGCAQCAGPATAVQRDDLRPGDTAPQDDIDRAAGGRARSNVLYGRQCEPYNSFDAAIEQARLLLVVPNIVEYSISSPASGDAANVWRRYLRGTGGMETHDGVADAGDRIATAFRADERHAPDEDRILAQVQTLVPGLLPRLSGQSSLTLTLDELGITNRDANPNYDSDAFTIGANLAGGIGSSDFGVDSRRIDGNVSFEKTVDPHNRLWCQIQVRAEFVWTVRDGIDFCPGNAGNPFLQEWLTIPMSRLEASGVARDVGVLVRFKRVRYDVPREFPNPDLQFPPPAPAPSTRTLSGRALFAFDSDRLGPEAETALREALGHDPEHADVSQPIVVRGHTDSVPGPTPDYNQGLSERRAAAVQHWLEETYPNLRGHVVTVGLGDTQPVASNDDAAGRDRNRRVEIDLRVSGTD